MAEVIRMPRMSDTMEEGNIVGWLKKVGDEVEPGDVLAEVETDKATMELESFHEGVLLHIGVEEGAVPVNAVLAVIGEAGEDYKAALAGADSEDGASAPPSSAPAEETAPAEVVASAPVSVSSGSDRVKASPLARKMAEDAGVDLATLSGSGDQGRIVKRDVEAASGQVSTPVVNAPVTRSVAPAPSVPTPAAGASYEDVPTSQMRKVIARRLAESKFGAPHFYLGIEVEMTGAIAYRKKLNEISDVKISFNDLVVKSCAHALRKHPAINSSWLGDSIRYNHDVNIGVAVAVEDGLLVPVIKHADRKGMGEINQEVRTLAGLAKERKLQPQQMSGNTFTISNLGMFDITEFTAIINPPDACILAVGSIKQKPIVKDGELAVGNIMKLTLSCDHRVVDGASGAKFLATLKGMLENPLSILI
ncbi:MAG: pyruvate dehydrogenase complex dihydrolipoamide acetyltransferase [Saprospiraceae bacterium]